ncbi:MAG TPA: PIN domain-containing protein [Burkholderiaceae bacterium]|nr:PIN domain-containing protein [Burkholderiaceae bacterium]
MTVDSHCQPARVRRLPEPAQPVSDALPLVPDVVVLDTCVLISSVLRPLLLNMGQAGCFAPTWSAMIGKEWCRTAEKLWQADPDDVHKQWAAIQKAHPLADMGDVSAHLAGLVRSDPKDWHVIAAGRAALERYPDTKVAVITRNIKDFHRAELRRLGLYLFDPDQLLSRYWQHDAPAVRQHLVQLVEQITQAAFQPDTLEFLLKRERLFRLNRLFQGHA